MTDTTALIEALREENASLRTALKPFAEAAREFTCAIAQDGIDDGFTVIATIHARREYEAKLSTADFSRAATALAALASVAPPAPALWAPVAGRIGLTRDGRRVTGLRLIDGVWFGYVGNGHAFWNPNGSLHWTHPPHPLDLVACADEVAG